MIEVATEMCSETKKRLLSAGNDCNLLKVKRKDSITATLMNNRAHTMPMNNNNFEREDTKNTSKSTN